MRAKKAKALRKIAQRLTVGLPKTSYTVIRSGGKRVYFEEQGNRKFTTVPWEVIGLSDCERKVYKSLKKGV